VFYLESLALRARSRSVRQDERVANSSPLQILDKVN